MTDLDSAGASVRTMGGLLRAARSDAGRTIDEVAAATRIRAQLLRDLEDDRLDTCGGAVYGRGHVRAVAHYLGVDPAPLVARFDEQSGSHPPEHVEVAHLPLPRKPSATLHVPLPAPPERSTPRWAAAGIATLVVLVALFAVGTLRDRPDAVAEPDLVSASAPPSATPTPAAPVAAPPPPAPKPTGALLGLRVVDGRSWISVRSGDKELFEGTVEAGWAQRFEDPGPLRVRIGNAGALRISCGNGMGAPAGAVGEVLTVVCSPEGLTRP